MKYGVIIIILGIGLSLLVTIDQSPLLLNKITSKTFSVTTQGSGWDIYIPDEGQRAYSIGISVSATFDTIDLMGPTGSVSLDYTLRNTDTGNVLASGTLSVSGTRSLSVEKKSEGINYRLSPGYYRVDANLDPSNLASSEKGKITIYTNPNLIFPFIFYAIAAALGFIGSFLVYSDGYEKRMREQYGEDVYIDSSSAYRNFEQSKYSGVPIVLVIVLGIILLIFFFDYIFPYVKTMKP